MVMWTAVSAASFVLGLVLWCPVPAAVYAARPQRCWSNFEVHGSTRSRRRPCCDDKCLCDDTVVDCSFSNLTYVPRVSGSVKFVNWSNNHFSEIVDPRFFVNVSRNVSGLDLYNNGLSRITFGVFRSMYKLKRVLLGGNRLSYDQVSHSLYAPGMKSLELKCGQLGNIPRYFFANRSCPRLRYIDMSWNRIQVLDMEEFQPLGRLETLILRYNRLEELLPAPHPSLKVWILHKNRLFDFPETCHADGTSLYPSLTVLDLSFNYISDLPDSVCLPSLTHLSLAYNNFASFYRNMFSLQRFPMLSKLSLTQMRVKIVEMENFSFNNSNVTDIELGWNTLNFSSPHVGQDVFQGCWQLRKLYLDRNDFADVDHERFWNLFHPLASSLEVLFLGNTGLKLRGDTFRNLTHLRKLYLYGNNLRSLPDGVFDSFTNLTVLKLGSNALTSVPATALSDATWDNLQEIDLSGNPFLCTCDILPLQGRMQSQPHKFLKFRNKGYRCISENTTVQDFYKPQQACILAPSTSVLIIGFNLILIVLLLVVIVLMAWRWHICLWRYDFRSHGKEERGARRRRFPFHVYVAYDEEDGRWVRHTLLPVLEGTWGLRACVHQRDFLPGRQDVVNMDKCLSGSHGILVIFSPSFATDSFRQFELGSCLEYAETSHPLVVVRLPGWDRRITDSMRAVLFSQRRFLLPEWREGDPDAARVFWKMLKKALGPTIRTAREERQKKQR